MACKKKTPSHIGRTPQGDAGEEVSHGETAPKAGRDAYPCLLVNLDALSIRARGYQKARCRAPFGEISGGLQLK